MSSRRNNNVLNYERPVCSGINIHNILYDEYNQSKLLQNQSIYHIDDL